MERRWSRRKRVSQELLLRYEGLGTLRGETLDISFEGACIHTGVMTIPPSVEVELIFPRHEDVAAREVRIGASVVRVYASGIAVRFQDYHEGSHRFLLGLLD